MRLVERSRDRVEARLAALAESYASYPVNQTTLTVNGEAYERVRDRCSEGLVDAYVRIYNGDGEVLLAEDDGSWVVPSVVPPAGERLETGIERAVEADTGVDCALTALDRVTILGVRHEDAPDRDPVYRLVTVFSGRYVDGAPAGGMAWRDGAPEPAVETF